MAEINIEILRVYLHLLKVSSAYDLANDKHRLRFPVSGNFESIFQNLLLFLVSEMNNYFSKLVNADDKQAHNLHTRD